MRALAVAVAVAALAMVDGPVAQSQEVPRLLGTLGADPGHPLGDVRGAAFRGGDLVVLTSPGPALHLYTARGRRAWGARGTGPAQLRSPQEVAWAGDAVVVRDRELRRIVTFDTAGRVLASRPFPRGLVFWSGTAGTDTLVALFAPGRRTLVRLRGQRQDTVVRLRAAEGTVRLSSPGVPSLEISVPFTPEPLWAPLPDGGLAVWDGESDALSVLDRTGRSVARLPLPRERFAVTEADREGWLAQGLPVVRGEALFEPLREKARTEIPFPDTLPAALGLLADPSGGVWVLRTRALAGQLWTHLSPGRPPRSIRFPAGEVLLAVGRDQLATSARTAAGPRIHVYAKPDATLDGS